MFEEKTCMLGLPENEGDEAYQIVRPLIDLCI